MPKRTTAAGSKPEGRYNLTTRFASECGLRGPLRFMVENTETGQSQTFDVHEPYVLIGRAHGCHLRLLHPDVSYRHAYCQVIQGRFYVFDLDSTQGIAWGTGLRREGLLTPADRLHIGPFVVRQSRAPAFTRSLESTSEDWELENEPLENIRLWFENATGRNSGNAMRPLRRQITILGRANCCHLKLSDASVSKAHCAIVRTAVGSWIIDLLGRSGTKLNDREIRFAPIEPRDRISTGRFRMSIRELLEEPNEELVHPPTSHEPHPDSDCDLDVADTDSPDESPQPLAAPSIEDAGTPGAGSPLNVHGLSPIVGPQGTQGTTDGLILAMMDQFSHLQQQLLAHTEQQMSMLTEMFATLHQAQNEAVLEQLRRIQTITTELNELRSERSTATASERGSPPLAGIGNVTHERPNDDAGVEAHSDEEQPGARRLDGSPDESDNRDNSPSAELDRLAAAQLAAEFASRQTDESEQIDASDPATGDSAALPGASLETVFVEHADVRQSAPDESDVAPVHNSSDIEPVEQGPGKDADRPAAPSDPKRIDRPRTRKPGTNARQDPEAHARLTTRISELERERNSRWKRLMQLVSNLPDE